MPAGMTIMAFAALANLNSGFHFQTSRLAAFLCQRIDKVGIGLIGIVFVRRMIIQSVERTFETSPLKLLP